MPGAQKASLRRLCTVVTSLVKVLSLPNQTLSIAFAMEVNTPLKGLFSVPSF